MQKLLLVIVFVFTSMSLISSEYNVDKTKTNVVKFTSNAPIEDFTGVTEKIDGYLLGEQNDPAKGSELYFQVELGSLDTGIGLRNRHMRENYLHTDKFPLAEYTGKIVSAKKNGKVWDVVVEGKMKIHGKEISQTINGTLTSTGNGFNIKTNFIVKLSSHDIEIPSLMIKKINEDMKLDLNFNLVKVD